MKDFCGRGSPRLLIIALKLVGQLWYCLGDQVDENPAAQTVPFIVVEVFLNTDDQEIEAVSLECLANCWMSVNMDAMDSLLHPEFMHKLLMTSEDNSLSLKRAVVWFLMNVSVAYPQAVTSLGDSEGWTKLFVDCLEGFDREMVVMVMNGLQQIFESGSGISTFHNLGGIEVLETLINGDDSFVSDNAQILYNKLNNM
jgi:hypothetical protein